MTSPSTRHFAALFAFLAFSQSSAFGQGTDQQREACTPDVFRLCSSYIPDADRITACLRGNSNQLSRACYVVFYPPQSTTDLRRPAQNPVYIDRRPVQAPRPSDAED